MAEFWHPTGQRIRSGTRSRPGWQAPLATIATGTIFQKDIPCSAASSASPCSTARLTPRGHPGTGPTLRSAVGVGRRRRGPTRAGRTGVKVGSMAVAGSFWDRVNEHQRRWSKLSPTRLIDEAARSSAAAGPRVRLPLFHPALFEVAAGQNWGVSMVSLRVRDVPVVVTLAGHLPEIPADALDRSSQLHGVRLPVPASSRRSSPTPPSRPLGAVISDSVWGASVVGSGAGERRA